jgi:hypothetical protein
MGVAIQQNGTAPVTKCYAGISLPAEPLTKCP